MPVLRQVLIVWLIFCLAQGVTAQDSPFVSLPASSFEISAIRERDTVAIPLIPGKGITFDDIQLAGPSPVWVRFGQRYDESFLDGIRWRKSADGTKLWAAVDLGILKAAGAYEVRVMLTAKGRQQAFDLTFTRPAAKLDGMQPINIHVVGGAVVSSDPLRLKETGNQTSLFHLPLPSPSFSGLKGSTLIRFPDTAYTVIAGQVFQADYSIDSNKIGDLPLGTTKGTMDINSPALAAPVTINVEITHTLPRYWIFICLLAGLAAGNFVRLFLSNKRALEDKREDGYALLLQIERETAGIKDPVFCQTITDLSETLKTTLDADAGWFVGGTKTLHTLTDLITRTNASYNAAKKGLDDALKMLQDKAHWISPLFINNNLSPYLTQSLAAAADFYRPAVGRLSDSDAQHASDLLTAAVNGVTTFVRDYCDPGGHVQALIVALVDGTGYPSAIDSAGKEVIKENSSRLADELKAVQPVPDDVSKLTALVQSIDSVQANLQKLLNFVLDTVSDDFAADYDDPADADMMVFKKAFDRWKIAMGVVLADPRQIFDKSVVVGLSKAWPVQQRTVGGEKGAGIAPNYLAEPAKAGGTVLWPWIKVSRYLPGGSPVALRSLIPTPAAGERQAANSYLLYSVLQTFFLLLVMSLAAYKFYATSFVGTFEDMLSIFLVAFGTDITVDKVNIWKGNN